MGKKVIEYPLEVKKSRRNTMAILEHERWNSFMITEGFIPATKEQILSPNGLKGKDYVLRRHGNITTLEGLFEFRRILDQRFGGGEKKYDVFKYDYQILDVAHWLLRENHYSIVKKS